MARERNSPCSAHIPPTAPPPPLYSVSADPIGAKIKRNLSSAALPRVIDSKSTQPRHRASRLQETVALSLSSAGHGGASRKTAWGKKRSASAITKGFPWRRFWGVKSGIECRHLWKFREIVPALRSWNNSIALTYLLTEKLKPILKLGSILMNQLSRWMTGPNFCDLAKYARTVWPTGMLMRDLFAVTDLCVNFGRPKEATDHKVKP